MGLYITLLTLSFISSLSFQVLAVLPHNLLSSPFLLVFEKQSSRIPKTFNQKKKKENTIFFILSIFFLCLLGVWVLRKYRKAKGNRFFLTLVCSPNIYMILSTFFVFAWCLGAEKMWESKGNFFFSFICLVSKKTRRDVSLILVCVLCFFFPCVVLYSVLKTESVLVAFLVSFCTKFVFQ